MEYTEYMQSPEWRQKRAEYFRSELPQGCQGCGQKRQLQLHHKTYERLGNEHLADLVPVCTSCHAIIHERHRLGDLSLWDATELALKKIRQHGRRLKDTESREVAPWKGTASTRLSPRTYDRLLNSADRGRRRTGDSSLSWVQKNEVYARMRDAEDARQRRLRSDIR